MITGDKPHLRSTEWKPCKRVRASRCSSLYCLPHLQSCRRPLIHPGKSSTNAFVSLIVTPHRTINECCHHQNQEEPPHPIPTKIALEIGASIHCATRRRGNKLEPTPSPLLKNMLGLIVPTPIISKKPKIVMSIVWGIGISIHRATHRRGNKLEPTPSPFLKNMQGLPATTTMATPNHEHANTWLGITWSRNHNGAHLCFNNAHCQIPQK